MFRRGNFFELDFPPLLLLLFASNLKRRLGFASGFGFKPLKLPRISICEPSKFEVAFAVDANGRSSVNVVVLFRKLD